MILRKPYAFLIKKFRIIHLLMFTLMAYLVYKTGSVSSYLSDYINNKVVQRGLASSYIGILMFLFSILIAVIALVVYWLMRFKNKPKLLYIIMIIGYLATFIIFWITFSDLKELELTILDPRAIRFTRDLILISQIFQYVMLGLTLIRGLGFDIKRFNFADDIHELDIDINDNEEFELVVGINTDKILRKTRRKRRELKYFFLENKFVLSFLIVIIIIVISFSVFINNTIYGKIYKRAEQFRTNEYIMKVVDSYHSSYSYNGLKIIDEGKTYVIVRMGVEAVYEGSNKLDISKFRLIIDNTIYPPTILHCNDYYDIGKCYSDIYLEKGVTEELIILFEIDDKNKDKEMVLRYRDTISYKSTGLEATYKKIKFNASKFDNALVSTKRVGEQLSFDKSILTSSSSLIINNYELNNSFIYKYTSCISNECKEYSDILLVSNTTSINKILLMLDMNFESNLINISNSKFINDFVALKYELNGKTYNHTKMIEKTPGRYKGNIVYYEVLSEVKSADKIWLEINIRGKTYTYYLKES